MRTRWQAWPPVWNQLHQFQNEMNRLFDHWGEGSGRGGAYPPVNLWEEGEQVHLEAEIPGLALEDLEIFVTGGNELTLKGESKRVTPDKGVWHRQERLVGPFERVVTLPFLVDPDKVEATLNNGVLLVKLGKHESAKPRKITVKGT